MLSGASTVALLDGSSSKEAADCTSRVRLLKMLISRFLPIMSQRRGLVFSSSSLLLSLLLLLFFLLLSSLPLLGEPRSFGGRTMLDWWTFVMRTCCDGEDGRRDLNFCEMVSSGENGMKRALLSVGTARNSGAVINGETRMLLCLPSQSFKVLYNMMISGENLFLRFGSKWFVLSERCELGSSSCWKTCDVGLTDQVIAFTFTFTDQL